MKRVLKKILCPVDFDETSFAALKVACDLAESPDCVLHLLYVVPLIPAPEMGVPIEPFPVTEHEARAELEKLASERLDERVRYKVLTRIGDPAVAILNAVGELGIDAVVMATHGRKGLGRLVLGSVAERVVRQATCPILTIKPKVEQLAVAAGA